MSYMHNKCNINLRIFSSLSFVVNSQGERNHIWGNITVKIKSINITNKLEWWTTLDMVRPVGAECTLNMRMGAED